MNSQRGFSLFELIITLAIVSLLMTLALPVYTQYVVRGKRFEAEMMLTKLASALEHYYTTNYTYENANLEALGFHNPILHNQYQLLLQSLSSTHYTIAAEPLGRQATNDAGCKTLRLTSLGERSTTGSALDCW